MNPKLRAFLLLNGLRADATETAAWELYRTLQADGITFNGPERIEAGEGGESGQRGNVGELAPTGGVAPVVPPAPVTVDRTAIDREGYQRGLDIMALCERHGITGPDREALLKPEVTLDQANRTVLDLLATRSSQNNPGFRPAVQVGVEDVDKYRASACAGLYLRAGLRLEDDRNLSGLVSRAGFTLVSVAEAGREFMGYSLREMARECLRRAGQPFGGDPLEMIGRAMTVGDLPNLLANVANKSLFEGYAGASETWEVWADGTGSVPDFKQNTLASISEFDDLGEIKNDTGYEYGERTDAKETYTLGTFGKLAAITRTTVINDDLGAMVDMYMSMGEAASRKIGDAAYGVLTTNGNMRDGVALFHANHGNLGTAGALSETTIAEAIKLAGLQKGLKGKQYLNIPLMYFMAPKAIEGTAEIFFASNQFSGSGVDSTRANIYGGTRFIRAYDARLDASSATAFYFAGPKRKTVRLFFLNGNRAPYLEQKSGWTTDGVEYKVRIDVVAKAVDWKAMVKNAGG